MVIQVAPGSAAGLQVPFTHKLQLLEEFWKPQGLTLVRPAHLPQALPVGGPAVQPPNLTRSVLAALPEPCSCSPVPPAPAEPDEGALN